MYIVYSYTTYAYRDSHASSRLRQGELLTD